MCAKTRVLITGANGFVGSHVCEQCVAKGWQVTCLVRRTSNLRWIRDLPVDMVYGEITSPASLNEAVRNKDVILHLAGRTKAPDQLSFQDANASGTRNLLEAVLEFSPDLKRFVHTSSLAAVGPSPTPAPIQVDHPPRPVTHYGASKLESEVICRHYSERIPITILRPPAVYGPRDADLLDFFRITGFGVAPILGDHEKYISIIHVRDLARAFLLAATSEKAIGKTYFITNEKIETFSSMIKLISLSMGKQPAKIRVSHELVKIVAFIVEMIGRLKGEMLPLNRQKAIELCERFWTCDSTLAREDLGFKNEIPLEQGFKETADWYRNIGWL